MLIEEIQVKDDECSTFLVIAPTKLLLKWQVRERFLGIHRSLCALIVL